MDVEPDTYRMLFDANPRPMVVADRETLAILIVNRAACDRLGGSRDELLAKTLRDLGDLAMETTDVVIGGRAATLAVIVDDAERRFRLLVEHSSDGIAITNTDNIVEYVSPGGRRILGYPPEEVVGRSAAPRMHPDDVATWSPPAPGETKTHVARIAHRDGSWRWIESSTTNLTHDPAVHAYVSNYRDITERQLADASLRRSEANFRALIERSPTAAFVHRHGVFLYVNPAAVALLGHASADALVGTRVIDVIHPDDREEVRARMAHTEQTGATPSGPGRMLRADGSVLVAECEGLRLDFDGEPANVVMGNDVTARNEVFGRMAVADRMLSIGTLAAGVAHEINNPLAYISANLDVLAAELPTILAHGRSRLGDAELRGLVADVREGVARVGAIVRDLRDLSSPAPGDPPGPVDVVAVMASAIRMAHNELRHHATVVQTYGDLLPRVVGDPIKLGQVFLNLLLNAAHAIAEQRGDGHEIRIRAAAMPDRGRVRVEIEDTGVGIPAAIVNRIFDPFFTTKVPGAGTGLGLAISHRIVHAMDGEIGVTSTPGRGTTFTITLPASDPLPVAAAPPAELPALAPTVRVLLIDDEPALGRAMRLLLAPELDVIVVSRAEDALARLAAGERFDAIVCDLMMPHVSGIEFHERLVATAPAYAKRLVFMTGGAFTPQAQAFLASLDRPALQKPFTADQLRRAIETVVR